MQKPSFLLLLITFSLAASSQVNDPVKWDFEAKKGSGDTWEIHLKAKIDKGWHLYSQKTPAGGPIPTSISFSKNPLIILTGETKEEGKLDKHFEPLFGVQVLQYSDKVEFIQTLKLEGNVKTVVKGSVEYMTCNDHECLPPATVEFSVSLK